MDKLEAKVMELERRLNKMMVGGRIIASRYTTNAGQSIPNGEWTIINFEDKVYDTHNCVTVGAAWKWIYPVTGYASVKPAILYATTTAWGLGESGEVSIYKNGVQYCVLDRDDEMNSAATTQLKFLGGSDDVYGIAGDYLDIRAFQGTGGALALLDNSLYCHCAITMTRFG